MGKEEDLSKYISSNLEGFSLRRVDELQKVIVVKTRFNIIENKI